MWCVLRIACLLLISGLTTADPSVETLLSTINNGSHSWTAGLNAISAMGLRARGLLGARRLSPGEREILRQSASPSLLAVPATYDVRTQYPGCSNVWAIKDQAYCGSCWSMSVVSAATDRLCIVSGGVVQANLSAQELTACCSYCGSGCDGGYPSYGWYYISKQGLVTGGDYGSGEGCQPYEVGKCGSRCPSKYPKLQCAGPVCTNKAYSKPYTQDKHYGSSAYLLRKSVQNYQLEIMQKGPVVATMDVYLDFYYYKSGVYQHSYGAYQGGHAVKLLGWGSEGGLDYWLAANSWGRSWGNQGFFKIRRGNNECLIEHEVSAGDLLPRW